MTPLLRWMILLMVPLDGMSNEVAWQFDPQHTPFQLHQQDAALHAAGLNTFFLVGQQMALLRGKNSTGTATTSGDERPTVDKNRREVMDNLVCRLPEVFSVFQTEQWEKARREVEMYDVESILSSYHQKKPERGYDSRYLKFYMHPYYLFQLLGPNASAPTSLTRAASTSPSSRQQPPQVNFFTIYKSANTYVRGLLDEYIKQQQRTMRASETFLFEVFFPSSGKHRKVVASLQDTERNKQYSFTIVRDPLSRFISGFTEVEWRRSLKPLDRSDKTTLPSSVDSSTMHFVRQLIINTDPSRRRQWEERPRNATIDRLETFILWLLRYNGSHSMMRECGECDHITPQGRLNLPNPTLSPPSYPCTLTLLPTSTLSPPRSPPLTHSTLSRPSSLHPPLHSTLHSTHHSTHHSSYQWVPSSLPTSSAPT